MNKSLNKNDDLRATAIIIIKHNTRNIIQNTFTSIRQSKEFFGEATAPFCIIGLKKLEVDLKIYFYR